MPDRSEHLDFSELELFGSYDREPGLGIFAGLNVLSKPTYIHIPADVQNHK